MNNHHKSVNWIFGVLASMMTVFGYEFQVYDELKLKVIWTYLALIVLIPVFSLSAKYLWDIIGMVSTRIREVSDKKQKKHKVKKEQQDKKEDKYLYIKLLGLIWTLYFIVFLGVYPGFFVYDAQEELMETVLRSFNNRHPLAHVLSMGGVIQAVHKLTDSYNAGIAAYILLIMTATSAVYALIAYTFYKKGVGKSIIYLFAVYLGVFPVTVMYALCSVKDGICGAFMLIVILEIKNMFNEPLLFFRTPKRMAILVSSAVLMMLFRNNAVYAFAVITFFYVIIFLKTPAYRRYTGRLLRSFVFAILAYMVINSTLLFATKAVSVGHGEILTVPIQQLARVYDYDIESLDADEIAEIQKYIPESALKRYNPKCSDMVKIEFNEDAFLKDKAGFLKLWLKIGLEHPAAYLSAFTGTSYGLWYPWTTIDGYRGNQVFTFVYGDSSYFGYETEKPGERHSLIPVIDRFYRWLSLDDSIQRLPIIHLLFSPGFMFNLMLFLLGFMIYSGGESDAAIYILPLFMYLTCVLGPMSLVRYAYYLWIVIPVMIMEIKVKRCYTKSL